MHSGHESLVRDVTFWLCFLLIRVHIDIILPNAFSLVISGVRMCQQASIGLPSILFRVFQDLHDSLVILVTGLKAFEKVTCLLPVARDLLRSSLMELHFVRFLEIT